MLASVLKSEIAALVSIRITNAFVAMRKTLASIAPLLERIEALDRRTKQATTGLKRFLQLFPARRGGVLV